MTSAKIKPKERRNLEDYFNCLRVIAAAGKAAAPELDVIALVPIIWCPMEGHCHSSKGH